MNPQERLQQIRNKTFENQKHNNDIMLKAIDQLYDEIMTDAWDYIEKASSRGFSSTDILRWEWTDTRNKDDDRYTVEVTYEDLNGETKTRKIKYFTILQKRIEEDGKRISLIEKLRDEFNPRDKEGKRPSNGFYVSWGKKGGKKTKIDPKKPTKYAIYVTWRTQSNRNDEDESDNKNDDNTKSVKSESVKTESVEVENKKKKIVNKK